MGVVEKGNNIYVPSSNLTNQEVRVEWQQNLSLKSRQYYLVNFVNKDQGNEESIIFIQKDYLDSFKNKKTAGDDFTVTVDDSFQYGQNKEKTMRWLVFHDKSSNAFQWRFIASALAKLGQRAADFPSGVLKQYAYVDIGRIQGTLSDPLRNF